MEAEIYAELQALNITASELYDAVLSVVSPVWFFVTVVVPAIIVIGLMWWCLRQFIPPW